MNSDMNSEVNSDMTVLGSSPTHSPRRVVPYFTDIR